MERVLCEYVPQLDKFLVQQKGYEHQYKLNYSSRSVLMRPRLIEHAVLKWSSSLPILARIIECESSDRESDVCIIGTVYKELFLRTSIIDDIREDFQLSGALEPLENMASEKDTLYLEDDSGRIEIRFPASMTDLGLAKVWVTGIVVAVKGRVIESLGTTYFMIEDVVYHGDMLKDGEHGSSSAIMYTKNVIPLDEQDVNDSYAFFLSGLEITGHENDSNDTLASHRDKESQIYSTEDIQSYEMSLRMMVDFLLGRFEPSSFLHQIASRICRVFIAGNSIQSNDSNMGSKDRMTSNAKQIIDSARNAVELDHFLAQLLVSIPVTILPGSEDPSIHFLPQQPWHPCLLPISRRFSTLCRATNPMHCTLDQRSIWGHSGQPIHDIASQIRVDRPHFHHHFHHPHHRSNHGGDSSTMEVDHCSNDLSDSRNDNISLPQQDPWLEILGRCLRWGHLAPTAPDTLPSYPVTEERDYFLLEDTPDIFFCGNQPQFSCGILPTQCVIDHQIVCKDTLLLNLPIFRLQRMGVLVNLRTLKCSLMHFQPLGRISSASATATNAIGTADDHSNHPLWKLLYGGSFENDLQHADRNNRNIIDYSDSQDLDI